MKVACPVWSGGKSGDDFKGLPITISGGSRGQAPETAARRVRTGEEGTAETVRTEVRTWESRSVTGESVRELSERCERDARRYDGGFPLY